MTAPRQYPSDRSLRPPAGLGSFMVRHCCPSTNMSSVSRERSAFVVALTGGIASGKSAVARHFEQTRIPLFDADRVAHSLVQAGQAALQEISSAFGNDAITPSGDLDRKRMRDIVFDDAQARRKLE